MKIHIAHLDPSNGMQSMINADSREGLEKKILAWAQDLHPDANLAEDDDIIDYLHNNTEDYVYTGVAEVDAYNSGDCHTALMIWEWVLDHARQQDATEGPIKDMNDCIQGVGYGQMRDNVLRIAPAVERLYAEIIAEIDEDEFRDVFTAYDWEFVPAVCELMDWKGEMLQASYRTGPISLPEGTKGKILAAYNVIAEDRKVDAADRAARAEYKAKARAWAGRLWGYEGLVDDAESDIDYAYRRGETDIEALIQKIGDELDLSEPDEMTAEYLKTQYPV